MANARQFKASDRQKIESIRKFDKLMLQTSFLAQLLVCRPRRLGFLNLAQILLATKCPSLQKAWVLNQKHLSKCLLVKFYIGLRDDYAACVGILVVDSYFHVTNTN